jgi:hypothetical protein
LVTGQWQLEPPLVGGGSYRTDASGSGVLLSRARGGPNAEFQHVTPLPVLHVIVRGWAFEEISGTRSHAQGPT